MEKKTENKQKKSFLEKTFYWLGVGSFTAGVALVFFKPFFGYRSSSPLGFDKTPNSQGYDAQMDSRAWSNYLLSIHTNSSKDLSPEIFKLSEKSGSPTEIKKLGGHVQVGDSDPAPSGGFVEVGEPSPPAKIPTGAKTKPGYPYPGKPTFLLPPVVEPKPSSEVPGPVGNIKTKNAEKVSGDQASLLFYLQLGVIITNLINIIVVSISISRTIPAKIVNPVLLRANLPVRGTPVPQPTTWKTNLREIRLNLNRFRAKPEVKASRFQANHSCAILYLRGIRLSNGIDLGYGGITGGAKTNSLRMTAATGISRDGDETRDILKDVQTMFDPYIVASRAGQSMPAISIPQFKTDAIRAIANASSSRQARRNLGISFSNWRLVMGYIREFQVLEYQVPPDKVFSGNVLVLNKSCRDPNGIPLFLEESMMQQMESYAIANIQFEHTAFGYFLPRLSDWVLPQDSLLLLCNGNQQWPAGYQPINGSLLADLILLSYPQVQDLIHNYGLTWDRLHILYSQQYNIQSVAQLKNILQNQLPDRYPSTYDPVALYNSILSIASDF